VAEGTPGRFDPAPFRELVDRDWPGALREARASEDPWRRALGLGWAARFAADADVVAIADEALTACAGAAEPYVRVGASAWPLRALIERGHGPSAAEMLPAVLERAGAITNPVSRVDALFLVWQAVYPLGGDTRRAALTPLLDAAAATQAWKPGWVLELIAYMAADDEPALADLVLASIPDDRRRRAAARRLAAGERQQTRRFFW
jgi:hypothetical protein